MRETINITMEDGSVLQTKLNTAVSDLLPSEKSARGLYYIGALINNEVSHLSTQLESDAKVRFLDMTDAQGWRIYRSSATFLLSMAIEKLYDGKMFFSVEHSLGTGFFCRFGNDETCLTSSEIGRIEDCMRELAEKKLPIQPVKIPFEQAMLDFEKQHQKDKYKLLRFRNPAYININSCAEFSDLSHGVLAPHTGMIAPFKCIPHECGLIIQFASQENAPEIAEFQHQPNLFNIFQEYKKWGRILGVRTAGDLNEVIADGNVANFIRIAEALHEKKIGQLADRITARKDDIKWIFMAGPSSSGKTTFAKRLAVQLKVNGLDSYLLSIDDFFVERDKTPRDENGNLDFEDIETVDIPFLHEHLGKLDRGEQVTLPRFDFTLGIRKFRDESFQIGKHQIVIIEGIHGLNPRIWDVLPSEHIFKIYISALTQLSLDYHNRLSTTDNRLMRRIVRDHKFRGNHAIDTLRMWPSVRRGEKKWIFPYQKEADFTFNSALDYEIPVLKMFLEPLLLEIKPYHEVYPTARRLMEFSSNFLNIRASMVPPTSLLREFTGKSSFHY